MGIGGRRLHRTPARHLLLSMALDEVLASPTNGPEVRHHRRFTKLFKTIIEQKNVAILSSSPTAPTFGKSLSPHHHGLVNLFPKYVGVREDIE